MNSELRNEIIVNKLIETIKKNCDNNMSSSLELSEITEGHDDYIYKIICFSDLCCALCIHEGKFKCFSDNRKCFNGIKEYFEEKISKEEWLLWEIKDTGDYGFIGGLFLATTKEINSLLGKTIYLGDVQGKFSDVSIYFDTLDNIRLVSDDGAIISWFLQNFYGDFGYNPVEIYKEQSKDRGKYCEK